MPLKDQYLLAKASWKQRFGLSSARAGSSSAREDMGPSPSPTLSQSQTPMPNDAASTSSGKTSFLLDPPLHTQVTPDAVITPTSAVSAPTPKYQVDPFMPQPVPTNAHVTSRSPESTSKRNRATTRCSLKTLLRVLESSSNVFPPLKSVACGLNTFVEILEASRASPYWLYPHRYRATLDSLLEDMSGYTSNIVDSKMTNSVKNLWLELDQELNVVQDKLSRSAVRRHVEALDEAQEISKCYQRIHSHLERLALNANLSMWGTVNESAIEMRLQRLSPALSAVYNSAKSVDVKRRLCAPGTRGKELDKLLSWAHNSASETEDVYWVNGMAGTGKTTIAYSLCAELEKRSELGASFFCSRLIPECRDVNLIIPCIAYQLARFSAPFRYALSNVLEIDPDVHARMLKLQFENLLVAPLNEVKGMLPTHFVVVIDALDECEREDSVGQILDVLLSCTRESRLPVRFLLSSRPESNIYQKMMTQVGTNFKARLVLHDLDVETVQLDIRTYLESELADIGLTSAQLAKLVSLSGAFFIFASTAARYIIEGQELMEHEERLSMVLGLSTESTNDKNKAIDQLYTSILQTILQKKSINKLTWSRLKTLIDTVICAQEPMTTDGLARLLGEKSGKHVEALLRQLSSVLNIVESTGLVTTLHASFSDYMLEAERSASFHCDPIVTHSQLSDACFNAIRVAYPQFNICGFQSSYVRDGQALDQAERSDRVVSPQLLYASRYWMTHLKSGKLHGSADLLWDFLSMRLLLWIEILNIKGCIDIGPLIMQQAEIWARANEFPEETIELAHDAWRFVTMFAGHSVAQSTPHLYMSMLPFWPASSPISKHYRLTGRMRHAIQLSGTAIAKRRLTLLATWAFNESVNCTRFSPDGSLIALNVLSSVYLLDSVTGSTFLGPLAHRALVRSIAFSPNGMRVVTGSEDGAIRIWCTADGTLVNEPVRMHSGYVVSVSFFPDGARVVSSGGDKTIWIWEATTGTPLLGPIRGHRAGVASISVSPDGTRIASGSIDQTIRVWDAQSGRMALEPLRGHTSRIDSVCFSPDGLKLASASWDTTVRVWSDLLGSVTVQSLRGHVAEVNSVAFSPDGNCIASGSLDNTVRLWGGKNNLECIAILRGHMETVLSVAFSSDGSRVISGSHDRTARVWDARIRHPAESLLDGHTGSITCVAFSRDGNHILSCSDNSTMSVWNAKSGQLVAGPFRGHTDRIRSACFSPDGTQIISGSKDKTVRWWDAQRGNPIGEAVTGHTGSVFSVCYSPAGALVASCSADQTIRLWDSQSRKLSGRPITEHTGAVQSVCFSPDGSRLVSGSADGTVMIWDVESRKLTIPPLRGHANGVGSIDVSSDGTRIVSGSWDRTIRLWDLYTGKALLAPLQGHNNGIGRVQFSPDGRHLVSHCTGKSLRIWDTHTGNEIGRPLWGHTEMICSCSFSPCGRRIVSGSNDRTIRVWDVAHLAQAHASEVHQHDIQSNGQSLPSHRAWIIQEDGWVVGSQNQLLVWVPPDLRHVLMSPRNSLLISNHGSLRLGFESAKLGEGWADNYTL